MQQGNNLNLFSQDELPGQDDESIDIGALLRVFWLRRYLFLTIATLVIVSGIAFLYQITPRYTSETKILVGIPKSRIVDVEAVVSGNLSNESAVKSEVEVLNSRDLAKKIILKLNLLALEEFNSNLKTKQSFLTNLNPVNWLPEGIKETIGLNADTGILTEEEKQDLLIAKATNAYLEKVKASAVKGTQVIAVSVESVDPKLAAKIANIHAETYITSLLEAKFEATQKATSWLETQLADLRAKVEKSEKAVEAYRIKADLARGTSEAGLVGEQLSEINRQLILAKAQRAEASARLAQVNKLLASSATDIESANEVLSSSLIQSLRREEIELSRKISDMSVELGLKHPQLIRTKAELDELKQKIKHEIAKIASGLKHELDVASARENSLQASLDASEKKSGAIRTEEVQLRALEREANANKLLFETFLNRFKETSSTQGLEEADARIISAAEVPSESSFPKKKLMLLVILMVGIISGTTVIFLLEMLHLGFRTPEEVEELLGVPVIGLIPGLDTKINPADYIVEKPNSSMGEAVSSLRMSLTLSDPDKTVKTIVVTSTSPGEGKSTLSLCLGRSAAIAGQKVILVDADFRRPTIEKKLGLSINIKGLTDFIMSKGADIEQFVYQDEKTGMFILPKGGADYINPVDIFASNKMEHLLETLKAHFDLIIFDTPPVMAVSDARVLASLTDKTIFVIAWDKTSRKLSKTALMQLIKAHGNIAGVTLQQVNFKQYDSYASGGYGYYYSYSKYGQYYTD